MTTDYTATKTNPRQTPHLIISLWITIILCFISSISYSIFNTPFVHAEEYDLTSLTHKKLNDAERGSISTGCSSIQTGLKNLQRNDSKIRVLLGTSYQTLLTNFISTLNVRLVKNNLPDPNLTHIQSEMFTSRNDFTNLFVIYSQHLESLISLDCKNQPDNFYYELENVRFLRDKLETSVAKTNNIITSHLQAVDQLRHNLNNSAKKTEQEKSKEQN